MIDTGDTMIATSTWHVQRTRILTPHAVAAMCSAIVIAHAIGVEENVHMCICVSTCVGEDGSRVREYRGV